MGGAYFCGACGKKLTPTSFDTSRTALPSLTPPPMPSTSPLTPAKSPPLKALPSMTEERKEVVVTPVKEEDFRGVYSSGRRRGVGEENKENAAPSSLSPGQEGGWGTTPVKGEGGVEGVRSPSSASPVHASMPSSSMPHTFAVSPTQPTSPPSVTSTSSSSSRPSFTASSSPPLPSPSASTSREQHQQQQQQQQQRLQRTPSVPSTPIAASASTPSASLPESSLVASIRRELRREFDLEQEILNMERDDLEQRVSSLTAERDQLQSMVEAALSDYQQLVDDTAVKRNDYRANMGILEAEMANLRERTDRENGQLRDATGQLEEANRVIQEQALLIEELRAQFQGVSGELEELKGRHSTLRDTATSKLKASAGEYMAIRQREQEKDILLHEIRRELQSAMEKNAIVGGRCKEAEERSERLGGEVSALEEELRDTRNELVGMSRELGEVKRVADEWRGRADESHAIAQRYKEQVLEQREKMRRDEKERRDGGRGGDEGERWRTEANHLRGELERKEAENRELMEMVESLIAQVEQQKQDHDDTY